MSVLKIKAKMPYNLEALIRSKPELFQETTKTLAIWGDTAREEWLKLVKNISVSKKQPSFWIKNYLGQDGHRIRWEFLSPLEIRVFRDGKNEKYNFGSTIEKGRATYDMKQYLQSSNKVRISKAGIRYLVIPIKEKEMIREADVYVKKVGEKREIGIQNRPVLRNIYSYNRQSKGNLVEFSQIDKLGRMHPSQLRWFTMSENSKGWLYPAITGFAYSKAIHEAIRSGRATIHKYGKNQNFNQSMAQAIAIDIEHYVKKKS